MDEVYYGGVEAGGTKFVCAIGRDAQHILAQARFPTTTPEETLSKVADFFAEFMRQGWGRPSTNRETNQRIRRRTADGRPRNGRW